MWIPDDEELGEVGEARGEEAEEVVIGEVIGDGDEEEEGGADGDGGRVGDGWVPGEGAVEVDHAAALREGWVGGGGGGGEEEGVVGVD